MASCAGTSGTGRSQYGASAVAGDERQLEGHPVADAEDARNYLLQLSMLV